MRRKLFEIIEIGDLADRAGRFYDYFMLSCIIISIIPLCFKQKTALFDTIDEVTVIIFIIDYILHWITADYKFPKRGKLAFLVYPLTGFALVDLCAILPSLTALHGGLNALKMFRSTRLLRLLLLNKGMRAIKLLRYSRSFQLVIRVIKKEREPLTSVFVLAVGYVFLCAVIMFQVEPYSFSSFFDALYWSMVTLTTVGYGDIYPTSDIGRVVSMLSAFMGIAIVALPTGIISAGFMSELSGQDEEDLE